MLFSLSKPPLDTSHDASPCLDPIFSACDWWQVWFLISAGDVPVMRIISQFAACGIAPYSFFHETHQVKKTVAMNATPTHHSQAICSLFKHVLCFKFHHSCTNTQAQTVLPVLTNLHPVWRWLTGVFNYADCTSSMCNTSPRLRVLLTSCQSWRWVRFCIQRHVNDIKVNIQPLWFPWRDYFQCHLEAELSHKFTFLHQRFPHARTMLFGALSPTGLNCSCKLKLFFMNGLFLSPKKIHSVAEWNLPVRQDFMRLWKQERAQ